MNHEQGLQLLEAVKIMAIVRGVEEHHMESLADALFRGGIPVMEVTLNTSGALRMIERLQERFGEHMFIGAGTVLDLDDARNAIDAGASYLVTPNIDEGVIDFAASHRVPIFPGAMTPTEIVKAWKAGATAVKIFPSASLGIKYIKEIMAPLNHIPMMAVGGVNESNIREYIELGCYGVGIGSSLVQIAEIEAGRFEAIHDKAVRLVASSKGNLQSYV